MPSDFDAARERHQEAVWEDYTVSPPRLVHTGQCVTEDGQDWPCDFDRMRALADELAEALDAMPDADCGCETCDAANADKAAALVKWEASRG